jgi:predicted MFS family arabinose efflux permease
MAGGMGFGSTFGALLEPLLGWRGLFIAVAALGAILLLLIARKHRVLGEPDALVRVRLRNVMEAYGALLRVPRARRTYAFVLVNAVFHSGVYTWLGLYFRQRYGLGEVGIGLALLGYGLPGFLLGPGIGRMADRRGRRWFIPGGLLIAALSAVTMASRLPLALAALSVTLLSLGYDMTQPMLAGIVTTFGGKRPGQAMGLNVFTLFVGFGVGSLLFSAALRNGFAFSLMAFGVALLVAAAFAVRSFAVERPGGAMVVETTASAQPPML